MIEGEKKSHQKRESISVKAEVQSGGLDKLGKQERVSVYNNTWRLGAQDSVYGQ